MDPIAKQLNNVIRTGNPHVMEMLSIIGGNLFFPKGILSQSAEAKEKAHKINATIGIATEKGHTMFFPSIMDAVCHIPPEDSINYAPSYGIPALRKAWRESLFVKNPSLAGKDISLPVVTCGITHALSIFADMWINPNDVIILPDMFWGNYNLIFKIRYGAKISHYSLFSDNGGFNIQAFETKVKAEAAQHEKITVLLNFPQNPSGYTVSGKEALQIVDILTEVAQGGTNVMVVADDAYFGLVYEDGILKESLLGLICGKHPRLLAIKLDGATKESFVWGLRVGFITYACTVAGDAPAFYDALERKTGGAIRGNISNASHLSQTIVLNSMQDERYAAEKNEKFELLRKRAQTVKKVLADPKYNDAWEPYPFNSGYFMCIRLKAVDAETLRLHLLEKYGVGLIAMGKENLRVAFSCMEEAEIPQLFNTVLKGVQDLNP